ncbi:hypothetical protein RN001_006464 [Aquatica leii]|uniref:DNA mismatch repair proteins mutS family domain-containing protein n=1 Tax=Aquatica leii TaxID=1421715 RepID=A0AAN7Q8V1_9COLE|nr:hypothetical protein RN001_006464 [Aquatica leii]
MTNVEPVHTFNLDLPQQQSFVRYFRGLPEKPAATIRFFNRSDFYTVHGEDASFAAHNLFETHIIKYMGEQPKLSYVVLSRSNFEKFVRDLLLVKQYRVEVYVKPPQSKNNDWTLEYKGSPGNLTQFEELLFENNEIVVNSIVMSIKIVRGTMVAVSCVNATEGQFVVSEFNDNELFTDLEAVIAQISPKECIIPTGESPELVSLKTMLERSQILVSRVKRSDFVSDDIDQDLNRLLYFLDGQQRNSKALPEMNLTEAMGCLQVAIKYLNLAGDENNYNQFKLSMFDARGFVRLDSAAITALNLFPMSEVPTHNQANKLTTIKGVLDRCCTPQGHRLLAQWLRQPLRDQNLINERLEVVEALVNDAEMRHMLYSNNLTKTPDLLMLAKKLSNHKASLQDCYRVYQTVGNIPAMISVLRKSQNSYIKAMLIDPICDLLIDMERYQNMIEETLDLDLVDRGEYFVKPSYNEELEELSNKKASIEEKMQKALRRAADDLGFESGKSIKLECTDQHGYFFRVTLREEHALRKNKNFEVIDAVKGGVRFTNDKLKSLNENYYDIKESYEQQQKSLVKEVFDIAAGYADTLRSLNIYIAKVDVLVSFANVSANTPIPFVKPKLFKEGSGILKLTKVRHPCLELQDGVTFIPNSVDFKSDERVLYIITGPNMGGKSTYIRSIGVSVLLAHIGCFVPCTDAEISIVDCILARVGATDSQLKGLSTFMLEMVETSSIIKSATHNSLVIIDELGRGTSTYDGCGIAWAIAEYLATTIKCFSLFTTHFHEITGLSEMYQTVHNLHVTAVTTEKTITPLYQIRQGPCDRSYGIHCAQLVEFPSTVIEDAQKHLEELEDYNGMKLIKDYEISLKRKIVEEGDQLIQDSLKKCKKIDLSKSDEELLAELQSIKDDIQSNLFVKGLLTD